jgi:purine-nucleoside phosphorylase
MINNKSPVFTAEDYLTYLRSIGRVPDFEIPKSIILYYQSELVKYVNQNHRSRKIKLFGSELILLKKSDYKIGMYGGFGVGAPATATIVDLFCALGVEHFFIVGMAGALQPDLQTGSLILSTGALREEGVSGHYLPEAAFVASSSTLVERLSAQLNSKKHIHHKGITWTTDTPFREMQSDVLKHQSNGVLAVDMETAAMLAVAEANHKSGFAAFSITDSLADGKWVMPKDLSLARQGLFTLFEGILAMEINII